MLSINSIELSGVLGGSKDITFTREVSCQSCSGTGAMSQEHTIICPACDGKGENHGSSATVF